jgi:hypothetical protein
MRAFLVQRRYYELLKGTRYSAAGYWLFGFIVNCYDLEQLTSAVERTLLNNLGKLAQAELTCDVMAW